MKHNYDEPTMQAAIDRACEETKKQYNPSSGTLMLDPELHYRSWPQEKPARLHLLKSALDFLPEPPPPVVDGKTPGQVCHESMYSTPEWKWLLAGEPVVDGKTKAACESAASAVLAAFGNKPAEIHSTFTAHGKEWTPAVGNVVTLKSGSPKMTVTVLSVHKDNASVSWFNDGVVNSASFNVSTLIPA